MPRRGGKRKKSRTQKAIPPDGAALSEEHDVTEKNVPKSIVAKAGKVNQVIGDLINDLRKLMNPYTATKLHERRYNRMKDYAAVSPSLGVSHLLIFSQTKDNVTMRLARSPEGPTLHFRVNQYSLSKQIRCIQKRPFDSPTAFLSPPLVVLNNFSQSQESHIKLMRITFQYMFPTINIKTIKLSECRRVVLFHLNEKEEVEIRHYAIKANPVGINKSIKRVITSKIPNLGNLQDISEFVEGYTNHHNGSITSDSEMEDENSRVTLVEKFVGKGNLPSQRSAMKLIEIGPRMTLELFKVEQGINEGDILYHKFVHKTPEEAAAIKAKVEKAKKLKVQRKAIQDANVEKKRKEREDKRSIKLERKRQKTENGDASGMLQKNSVDNSETDDSDQEEEEEDDDVEDENEQISEDQNEDDEIYAQNS